MNERRSSLENKKIESFHIFYYIFETFSIYQKTNQVRFAAALARTARVWTLIIGRLILDIR